MEGKYLDLRVFATKIIEHLSEKKLWVSMENVNEKEDRLKMLVGEPSGKVISFIVNDYYEEYLKTGNLEDALKLVDDYASIKLPANLQNFEDMKDNIFARLLNYEYNEEYLIDVPHSKIADMAITYHVRITNGENGIESYKVDKQLFNDWGVSMELLHETALKNTRKIIGLKEDGIFSVIANHVGADEDGIIQAIKRDEAGPRIDVLTSKSTLHGAIHMLDKDILAGYCKANKCDEVWILPCSIHEVLLTNPEAEDCVGDLDQVKALVSHVNSTELSDKDVLSSNVYAYNKTTGVLRIADKVRELKPKMQVTAA